MPPVDVAGANVHQFVAPAGGPGQEGDDGPLSRFLTRRPERRELAVVKRDALRDPLPPDRNPIGRIIGAGVAVVGAHGEQAVHRRRARVLRQLRSDVLEYVAWRGCWEGDVGSGAPGGVVRHVVEIRADGRL